MLQRYGKNGRVWVSWLTMNGVFFVGESEAFDLTQKLNRKVGVNNHKTPSVRQRVCAECPFGSIHETGSMIWVSCKFQSGWRSISSQCNLPDEEFLRLAKKEKEK
jgi:hypothetical protein